MVTVGRLYVTAACGSAAALFGMGAGLRPGDGGATGGMYTEADLTDAVVDPVRCDHPVDAPEGEGRVPSLPLAPSRFGFGFTGVAPRARCLRLC